jgi:membrane-associated phospholipid phosphatase
VSNGWLYRIKKKKLSIIQIMKCCNWFKKRHQSPNHHQSMETPREQQHTSSDHIFRVIQLTIDFILVLLFGVGTLLFEFGVIGKPRIIGFIRDDPNISKPYFENETVPTWLLVVIFLPISLGLIFIGEVCFKARQWVKSWYNSLYRLLHTTLVFLYGLVATLFVTVFGKVFVGALRPDFLRRCKPNYRLVSPTETFITENICTGVASVIEEGRKSFPSGHSSFAWFCAIFMALYIERCVPEFDTVLLKPILQVCVIAVAIFVSASRLTDYRHHFLDVSVGALIGILIAIWIIYILRKKKRKREPSTSENDLESGPVYHQAKVL